MAKKVNLPKATVSSKGDLITIIQSGVEKNISKSTLLKHLEDSLKTMSSEIGSLKRQLSRKTINKDNPSFSSAISAGTPSSPKHLTTKSYVDTATHNIVRNDGSTPLIRNLSFRSAPAGFKTNDVVTKKFVDDSLKATLKTIKKNSGSAGYPKASAGDCYILENNLDVFAGDGPEVQEGDLLMCIENSKGGTHGSVGHQFAIVNTNVVFAKEDAAGILKIATDDEVIALDAEDSAITPFKYKRALETGSDYNRTIIDASTHTLTEQEKGIIGVNTRNRPVTITLPSIGRTINPKILKYTIKDEGNNASKNTITITTSGGDTIQGTKSYIISSNSASVKLYNNGENTWYLESNALTSSSGSGGVKTFATLAGELPLSTGAYESVMAIDVDLKEYPIGTGFKVVAHSFCAANTNVKTIAIGVKGTQVLASSLSGTTAPNALFVHHEATILHTDTPSSMAFGFCLVGADMAADGSAAGLTNSLSLDWDSKITVSVDVNAATAATDVKVYALQVIPLK